MMTRSFLILNFLSLCFADQVVQLTQDNINEVLKKNELVLVNFYADWCEFSKMLAPIFAEGSDKVAQRYPVGSGKVRFAKVDCEKESDIAQKFEIQKYPTMKLFRYGEVVKREYRGQRSPDAFLKYIQEQLISPIKKITSQEQTEAIADNHKNMLAYIVSESSNNYKNVYNTASQLRNECHWYVMSGPNAQQYQKNSKDIIYFRQPLKKGSDTPFTDLSNGDSLTDWARELCVPRVRELTFDNAEELTEEDLPFMILFHHPNDTETPAQYSKQVELQLANDKGSVIPLTADGLKFAYPLQQVGKTAKDLPLIAIDSFKHLLLWKHNVKTSLGTSGLLKQFVDDLNSGKLHRDFHSGQDAAEQQENVDPSDDSDQPVEKPASPPESVFKRLKPSRNRYTVLKDEL